MDILTNIINAIHQECDIPVSEIHPDSALMDDLDLSSLEIMTLIGVFEDQFHIVIPETKFREIVTVEDLKTVIEKLL